MSPRGWTMRPRAVTSAVIAVLGAVAFAGPCGCKGAQAYGMSQVRARVERGARYGQVILLWPESNTRADDGELDLAETPHPDKKSMVQTIHWGTSSDQQLDDKWVDGD